MYPKYDKINKIKSSACTRVPHQKEGSFDAYKHTKDQEVWKTFELL